MKKKTLIYGCIFLIFALFILFWATDSGIVEELAIWATVIFLGGATLIMIIYPLFMLLTTKEKFKIKKGNHYSGFRLRMFISRQKMVKSVMFDNSCRYTGGTQLTNQINKAFGFGARRHHKNSIRLGWRWNEDTQKIDLFIYEYVDGEPIQNYFKSISLNKSYKITIKSDRKYWFGKELNPYFGGEAPAPHDIQIIVKS